MIKGCGVIIVNNFSILMGQRVKAGDELQWCIPGGKIEEGETPEQAAIREVYEECGLEIKEEDLEFIHLEETETCKDYTFAINKFIGEVKDNPQEMINFKWFKVSDFHNIDKEKDIFPATLNSLFKYYIKNIRDIIKGDI